MKISKDERQVVDYGSNIFTILQMIFLVLKLAGLVNWSWWFVLTPTFVSIMVTIVMVIILLSFAKDK